MTLEGEYYHCKGNPAIITAFVAILMTLEGEYYEGGGKLRREDYFVAILMTLEGEYYGGKSGRGEKALKSQSS